MNENTKTVVLLAVAALAVLVVWSTNPSSPVDEGNEAVGKLLFPDFKNPLEAASLEIVKYNEETGDVVPFEVAQVKGIWAIPSHENYPADAKEHLAQAAASLMDLKVLGVASENTGDHELYGVLDPTDKGLKPGTPGVGMKVVMKDKDGKTLVQLIIGKQDGEQPDVRFVRCVGQERVCTVSVSTDKLSTKFDDWIEKDLLKLNALDLSRLFIQDYSIDEARRAIVQRGEITLDHNDAGEVKWKVLSDQVFGPGDKWEPVPMAADEQLNAERLDTLKTALDDLKIVDVARKPGGLSADLAADKSFANNKEAIASLEQRGFYLASAGGKTAIYSNEGEIRCLMNDGVQYILRFGNLADSGKGVTAKTAKDKAKDKKRGGADADDTDDSGVNRYIFVTTEFNPEAIAKPELQPLPKADEKKADEKKPEEKKPEEKKADEKKPEAKDAKKAEEKKPAVDPKAERERIEKENKRKQDEYDAKVAEGKKKVAELNKRFADWYYVISENVYKKIHVSRKDVIKKKEKKEGEKKEAAAPAAMPGDTAPDAFNQLKAENLEKK